MLIYNHRLLLLVFFLFGLAACAPPEREESLNQESSVVQAEGTRIVSLNGSITEILVELGLADEIVGVDVTST